MTLLDWRPTWFTSLFTDLRKFYACTQGQNETVTMFASRVEDIFSQAVELRALVSTQEEILKNVLYQGLRTNLKQASNYKYETVKDYDKFKIELRKIENSINEEKEKDNKAKCSAATKIEQKSELGEVKELLQKMNARIEKLEKDKEQNTQQQQHSLGYQQQQQHYDSSYQRRGFNTGYRRNFRGNTMDRGKGRGTYQPTRPTGAQNMQPTCYNCNKKGHIARNCPNF